MIKTTTVFIVLALAAVASAQLIYSAIRIPVASGTVCPADWTAETSTVVSPAMFHVRAPLSIGGRSFLVTEALVDRIWNTAAKRATAVAVGTLTVEASNTTVKHFCALLP